MPIAPSRIKYLQARPNQSEPTMCEIIGKKQKIVKSNDWLGILLSSKFFGSCPNHPDKEKKPEEKVFCIDCIAVLCRQCSQTHSFHNKLKIRKYMYNYVIKLQDIQKYFDCCKIQTYKINGEKAVHLNPRPQSEDAKPSTKAKFGGCCETCKRYIQDLPNQFCCIECKVSTNTNAFSDLSSKENLNLGERNCSDTEELSSFSDVYGDSQRSSNTRSFLKPRTCLRKRKSPRRAPLF